MNKRILIGSIVLNAILCVSLIVVLIPDEPELTDLSQYTQHDLSKALDIRAGVEAVDLEKLMGKPAVREFSGGKEEWHYCNTGHLVDEYIVFEVNEDRVVSSRSYTVSWLDVVYHHTQTPTEALIEAGGMGDCRLTAKWGTYAQQAPNKSMNFAPSAPDTLTRAGY